MNKESIGKKGQKKQMSLKELQQEVRETSHKHGFDEETLEQKILLLYEELGEFFKSVRERMGVKVSTHSEIRESANEAADVLYVLLDTCNKLEIDLESAFKEKLEEINRRKY